MPNFYENFGLNFIVDDDEFLNSFISYCFQQGSPIIGYYDIPYMVKSLGNVDIFLKTKHKADRDFSFSGWHTHCSGPRSTVWKMRLTDINITPKDALPTDRIYMFRDYEKNQGFVPIHMINADILPSFMENDVVEMQMCALPLEINYYKNEDDFAANYPKSEDGKIYTPANGSFFPAPFLYSHVVDENGDSISDEEDLSDDSCVLFKATVKELYNGVLKFDEEMKGNTFIRCVAETQFGEIIFAHTLEQVKPEQRDNLKVGAVICGLCVLSGDVAINEYEHGIIKDAEHNLKLIRHTFVNNEAERLRTVLAEDAVFVSKSSETVFRGADEIIDRIKYVHSCQKKKIHADFATIVEATEENAEYAAGTKCIALAYGDEETYDAIAFVDTNEKGLITRIITTKDRRYHFEADAPPPLPSILDDITPPDNVITPLLNRAKLYDFIDFDTQFSDFIQSMDNRKWAWHANHMIDTLHLYSQEDFGTDFANVFGYLFAKAIEETVNASKPTAERSAVKRNEKEAINGKLTSSFNGEDHAKLLKLMKKGRHFYKDFKFYIQTINPLDDCFIQELLTALITVQHIGTVYANSLFNKKSD